MKKIALSLLISGLALPMAIFAQTSTAVQEKVSLKSVAEPMDVIKLIAPVLSPVAPVINKIIESDNSVKQAKEKPMQVKNNI